MVIDRQELESILDDWVEEAEDAATSDVQDAINGCITDIEWLMDKNES